MSGVSLLDGAARGIRTPAHLAMPSGFQDRSLQPDLGRAAYLFDFLEMVVSAGIEPATRGFSIPCSTN